MDWIKQNLVLVVSLVVALALIGGSGYYFYSKIAQEGELKAQLAAAQATYDDYLGKTPFPSQENLLLLKQQQTNLLALRVRTERQFPILSTNNNVKSPEFTALLAATIDELKSAAVAANVGLPTNNTLFAFTAQRGMLQFDSNALPIMVLQLGDVKTLCGILFDSKIYEIFGVRRATLPSDSGAKMTYPQDYLPASRSVTTNALTGAVVYPYEVSFKSVTAELAAVLEKMAKSPAGILVKGVTVTPIEEGEGGDGSVTGSSSAGMVNMGGGARISAEMARRYGFRGGRRPVAATPAAQAAQTPSELTSDQLKKASQLKEKPFKTTLYIEMVKLQPLQDVKAATSAKRSAATATNDTSTTSN